MLLAQLNFGLRNDSWLEDHSHIFATYYYTDSFKCIHLLSAHLPFQSHLDFEPVCLADSKNCRIYSEMNTGDWWWYCAVWWKYTMFLTHIRSSVKGILWLTKGFERVEALTGIITRPRAILSLPIHCVSWLYGLLNQAKPSYGGIIAPSWWNLSILACCLKMAGTQSIKYSSIPR